MDFSNDLEMFERKQSLKGKSGESIASEAKQTTNWRLIIVTGIVSALNAVENSVLGMGEWPYMKEIDYEASAQFFGSAQSASKFGHVIFTILFSIWSFKSKSVKIPMLTSRFIAILACLIYLGIEYVPSNKRFVLMSVYVLLSIANSACTVLRGYIVMCSSTQDLPRAFAIIGLSVIVSLVVGPTLQLIFSGIAYPGYQVLPGIRFHVYSVPIWVSLFLTIITAAIIYFFMEDVHKLSENEGDKQETLQDLLSIEKIKKTIKDLRKSDLNWKLIGVCLFVKIAVTFSHATLGSIMSIIFMVQYGWTGTDTVRIGSTLMVGFGVIACTVLLLYIFCRLGEILPQEKVFVICIIASGLLFVITYPFEFNSQDIAQYNETTRVGCNQLEYTWCEDSVAVKPLFLMISIVVVFAPSMPMMHTALDTVYSRILGDIDQNLAHGAMTVVDDIIFIVTPILTTTIFTLFGVGPLWILKSSIYFVVAAVWLFNIKQIKQNMH